RITGDVFSRNIGSSSLPLMSRWLISSCRPRGLTMPAIGRAARPNSCSAAAARDTCPFAAPMKNRCSKLFFLFQQTRIAPVDGLAHRGEIVRALDRLDDELAVVRLLHLAVFANDHPGDILGA